MSMLLVKIPPWLAEQVSPLAKRAGLTRQDWAIRAIHEVVIEDEAAAKYPPLPPEDAA